MPAQSEIATLIEQFLARGGSDLFIIAGAKPFMRQGDTFTSLDESPLTTEVVDAAARVILSEADVAAFARDLECNTAIDWGREARLRVNLFMQQHRPGMVIRRLATRIPRLEELKLPRVYAQLAMEKRGLVVISGPPHSGKSTTLAAMVGQRNANGAGHIIAIEDPIEFVHMSQGCIIAQREVGIDTRSSEEALKNAARQSPDVVMIGELRDTFAVEQAIALAETGHLVLTTVNAGNAAQTIEKLLLFFPDEAHRALQLRLSHALRAVLVQRLVAAPRNKQLAVAEVLLNEGLARNLIREGRLQDLRECIEKGVDAGMQTFDQGLAALCQSGEITEDTAIAAADNPGNLRLQFMRLGTERPTQKTQF